MSKFIPKSRIKSPKLSKNPRLWSDLNRDDIWWVGPKKYSEQVKLDEDQNELLATKKRIESIPIETLTFADLYEFPFRESHGWVYDKNSNFMFQINIPGDSSKSRILSVLNSESNPGKRFKFVYSKGSVNLDREDGTFLEDVITIRGWGNLTGTGSYNFSGEIASKIQDTLGEFIAKKLTWFDWKPIK